MENTDISPLRTANYTGSSQKRLSGLEHLVDGKSVLPFHIADFWQWAYSDMLRNTQRGVLAEFIVKSALELGGVNVNGDIRSNFEPFDLLGPDISHFTPPRLEISKSPSRLEVKSAAYIQSWKPHPGTVPRITFSIAPAKIPDEIGDYKRDAPRQRNSDLYIFAVYAAADKSQNILDMSLWEFYVVKTSDLNAKYGDQKTVSLASLTRDLSVNAVKFGELCDTVTAVCQDISRDNEKETASD